MTPRLNYVNRMVSFWCSYSSAETMQVGEGGGMNITVAGGGLFSSFFFFWKVLFDSIECPSPCSSVFISQQKVFRFSTSPGGTLCGRLGSKLQQTSFETPYCVNLLQTIIVLNYVTVAAVQTYIRWKERTALEEGVKRDALNARIKRRLIGNDFFFFCKCPFFGGGRGGGGFEGGGVCWGFFFF